MKIISKATLINSIIAKRKPSREIESEMRAKGYLLGVYDKRDDVMHWNRRELATLSCEELALIYAKLPTMLEIDMRRYET